MRSVFELLVLLSSPSAESQRQAATALMAVVRGHTTRRVRAPRGASLRVPDRAREDVVAEVMVSMVRGCASIVDRMVTRSPSFAAVRAHALGALAVVAPDVRLEAHRAADLYVSRMVATAWISIARREARQPRPSTPTVDRARDVSRVEPGADRVKRALRAVEAALEVIAAERPQARATFGEMWSLAMDVQTMLECTRRQVGPDTSPRAIRAARDRLQQRHRRLRVLLVKALVALESRRVLDAEDAGLARRFVEEVLNRAPKGQRRARALRPLAAAVAPGNGLRRRCA